MITLTQLTDTQLVAIYQKNQDPTYFGELYNRYFTKVYHYNLGKVKNRDEAYDIAADTFVKLATKVQSLRNPELFIAWLFKMANNACLDALKAKGRVQSVDSNAFFNLEEDDCELEDVLMKEEQLIKLDAILNNLDYETKMILINKYFKSKSIEDLQKEMGLSKSAVKMRLARGRNRIAELMQVEQTVTVKATIQ